MSDEPADEIARERIGALDRLMQAEIKRIDNARTEFMRSVIDRFDHVNELRGALTDLGAGMATRRELETFITEYRIAHQALADRVVALHTAVAVGPTEVRDLVKAEAERSGSQAGRHELGSTLLSMIGLATGISGVLLGHFLK